MRKIHASHWNYWVCNEKTLFPVFLKSKYKENNSKILPNNVTEGRENLGEFPYFPLEGKSRVFSRISLGKVNVYYIYNIKFPFPSWSRGKEVFGVWVPQTQFFPLPWRSWKILFKKVRADFFIKGFFYGLFSTPLARLLSLQLFDPYGGYFFWSRRCLNLKNKNWVQRSYFIFNNF